MNPDSLLSGYCDAPVAGMALLAVMPDDVGLVSIHKWPFSAISASIFGIACATYLGTSPPNPLIFLTLRKIAHF